jgi:osmotically-inducible protein OsmY
MKDIERFIMADLENEPMVDAAKIGVEVRKGKGLFNRRQVVHVFGTVASEEAKQKAVKIVEKQAGDIYDVSAEALHVKH